MHAVTSAGVVYSVTRSCSAGMFPDCEKCDTSKRGRVDKSGEFQWGDCNDNVYHGAEFAEEFIDSAEKYAERIRRSRRKYLKRVMNLHNNKAGRLVRTESNLIFTDSQATFSFLLALLLVLVNFESGFSFVYINQLRRFRICSQWTIIN